MGKQQAQKTNIHFCPYQRYICISTHVVFQSCFFSAGHGLTDSDTKQGTQLYTKTAPVWTVYVYVSVLCVLEQNNLGHTLPSSVNIDQFFDMTVQVLGASIESINLLFSIILHHVVLYVCVSISYKLYNNIIKL